MTGPVDTDCPVATTAVALAVDNVSIEFGSVKALFNVTIEVAEHEVVGIIGPNGAGKSTLMAVIGGQAVPSTGSVRLYDRDITALGATTRAHLGLQRTFQSLELFDAMSVRDNVLVAAGRSKAPREGRRWGSRTADEVSELLEQMDLAKCQYAPVQSLPAPVRRIVSYCRAIVGRPRCVLLDEPAAGLSEFERQSLAERIRKDAADRGHALIVVEHDMGFVRNLCHTIYALDAGETIARGTFDEIASDPVVRKAYLGE
jgi:branched-chain amino acid transport system ATP-binding protein